MLNIPFMIVYLPFVLLLAALVVRCAWGIWSALHGQGLDAAELPT